MIREKEKIIKRFGTPILIKYKDGSTKQSKGLIERLRQATGANFLFLESFRRGDFLTQDNVENGCVIINLANNEKYLVIGMYPFVFKDAVLSHLSNLVVVNGYLNKKGVIKTADINGNIRTQEIDIIKDLECFVQKVDYQYKQTNPGINVNTEYVIYTPKINLNSLDKIGLIVDGQELKLEVIACNNFTIDGISYIEAKSVVQNGKVGG